MEFRGAVAVEHKPDRCSPFSDFPFFLCPANTADERTVIPAGLVNEPTGAQGPRDCWKPGSSTLPSTCPLPLACPPFSPRGWPAKCHALPYRVGTQDAPSPHTSHYPSSSQERACLLQIGTRPGSRQHTTEGPQARMQEEAEEGLAPPHSPTVTPSLDPVTALLQSKWASVQPALTQFHHRRQE